MLNTYSVLLAGKDTFPWLPIIGGCVGFVVVVALILTIVLLCRRYCIYLVDSTSFPFFKNLEENHFNNRACIV